MKVNNNMRSSLGAPRKKSVVAYSRVKRKILSHVWGVRIFLFAFFILIVSFLGVFLNRVYISSNASVYLNAFYNFLTLPIGQLATSDGRVNILVMGRAGGTHEGPDLTDSMMLVSLSTTSSDVKVISIPRDVWIPEIRAKINSAYYWGNKKEDGGGINFAKAISSIVVGVPIQYGVVIDFSGFKDVIQEIGGIEIDVENSFTDYFYPIPGRENDTCGQSDREFRCRYETLNFVQGKQLMDGETALKFVRSRHADGIEGTDTARQSRQQKVIEALKNKLANKNTYTNPEKDLAILRVLLKSIQTDLDYPRAGIVARLLYNSRDSIKSYVIPVELLENPPVSQKYDMQSVFVPKEGNGKWTEIHQWIKSII